MVGGTIEEQDKGIESGADYSISRGSLYLFLEARGEKTGLDVRNSELKML